MQQSPPTGSDGFFPRSTLPHLRPFHAGRLSDRGPLVEGFERVALSRGGEYVVA